MSDIENINVLFQLPEDMPRAKAQEISEALQTVGLTEAVRQALKGILKDKGVEGLRIVVRRVEAGPATQGGGAPFTPGSYHKQAAPKGVRPGR